MKLLELRTAQHGTRVKVPLPAVEALHLSVFVPNLGVIRVWAQPTGYGPEEEIDGWDCDVPSVNVTDDAQRRIDEACGLAFDVVCKGITQTFPVRAVGAIASDQHLRAGLLECIARMRVAETDALAALSDMTLAFKGWGEAGLTAISRLPVREVRDLDALDAKPSPSAVALAELVDLLRGEAEAWSKDYAERCRVKWEEDNRPERDLDPELGV